VVVRKSMHLFAFTVILVLGVNMTFAEDPASSAAQDSNNPENTDSSFQWRPALLESLLAATIANAERFANEPGTRDALHGPFFKNYLHDMESLHGWQDGDGVLTSYIAHPMEGSFAGFVERQNDPRYRGVEFGSSQRYWTSVMRSLAFSTAYSVAWSFGPYGEASLGNVDLHAPPGLVDLVGTSTMGLAWMIGEDMVDRYVIKRIENRYHNKATRALARSMLNPTRSYANILRFKVPWMRDSRPNVGVYESTGNYTPRDDIAGPKYDHRAWPTQLPFELTAGPTFQQYIGRGGSSCMGAAGEGAMELTTTSAVVIRIDGCQLLGFSQNYSGDVLNYMAGPRWVPLSTGRWKLYVQLLGGATKITHDYVNLALKDEVIQHALQVHQPRPEQVTWITEWDRNGFTTVVSGVGAYEFNNGLQLRVADVGYQHSWVKELQGMNYNNGLRFAFGISYRMGAWER
jgi:hypothetical protein